MLPAEPRIVVSIVSHGHGAMVGELLADLVRCEEPGLAVVLTLNIPETEPAALSKLPMQVIRNDTPRGFGANHNAAFRVQAGNYFCVLNPDVRIRENPFPRLVSALGQSGIGVTAPLVRNLAGEIEDSARRFPSPASLFGKLLGAERRLDYDARSGPFEPDWVAGMFMLFRRDTYASMGGFDERYFLYYEDIDICARLHLRGMRVVLDPGISVAHDARRASHSNIRHAFWHARSILRYFTTTGYLRLRRPGAR